MPARTPASRAFAVTLFAGAAIAASAAPTRAETLLERSFETRLQIDFAVADAAVRKLLPAGWETDVATSGGAKDCNLRMIFIDRADVTGPDDAAKGTSQLVILEVPVKKAGVSGRMIVDGIVADPHDAPGPFKVYKPATSYKLDRSETASAVPLLVSEAWQFAAANGEHTTGEHMGVRLKYERGVARRGTSEVKYFSGADPSNYQIGRIAQGLVPMRNATVPSVDRVREFSYQVGGGNLGALFDGTERLISIDAIGWHERAVYLP